MCLITDKNSSKQVSSLKFKPQIGLNVVNHFYGQGFQMFASGFMLKIVCLVVKVFIHLVIVPISVPSLHSVLTMVGYEKVL